MTKLRIGCVVLAAFVGGLVSMGCGGDNEAVKFKYPDIVSFCDAKARLECTEIALENCQSTEEACISKRRGLCAQTAPAGATYRPTEAEACLAAVNTVFQDNKYEAAEKATVQQACALLWGGNGGQGAQCSENYHCDLSLDLRCVIPTGETSGRCYVPEVKSAGDTCNSPEAVCTDGYFCKDGDCVTKRPVGNACGPMSPCKDELRCVDDGTGGKCEAKFGKNDECSSDDECLSGMCSPIGDVKRCVDAMILSPNEPLCADFR